ncbi:hypothetical protein NW754_001028 [Fusarium falciforme]|nr:hypothetical protein NW754_001028 [Fusarium falciforme]
MYDAARSGARVQGSAPAPGSPSVAPHAALIPSSIDDTWSSIRWLPPRPALESQRRHNHGMLSNTRHRISSRLGGATFPLQTGRLLQEHSLTNPGGAWLTLHQRLASPRTQEIHLDQRPSQVSELASRHLCRPGAHRQPWYLGGGG